jgi:hypothetical protein
VPAARANSASLHAGVLVQRFSSNPVGWIDAQMLPPGRAMENRWTTTRVLRQGLNVGSGKGVGNQLCEAPDGPLAANDSRPLYRDFWL